MKKIVPLLLIIFLIIVAFVACDSNTPNIEKYYLDSNGNLIAEYDNGSTVDLGSLKDTIANGAQKITVNADGFYVINDVQTTIKAKLPVSYSIDTNGNLIVSYSDDTTENLGKFGNDSINTIGSISVSDDGFYILNGIKTSIVAIETYNVTFNTGFSTNVSKQIIKDGYKVERPQIERIGYTLDGWYCNGEEWHFNSDVVKSDMVLTATWTAKSYNLQFNSDGGTDFQDISVEYDSNYNLPIPEKDLYTFKGWKYNQASVNNSGKWNIDANAEIVLTATWERTTHNVFFNSAGGSSVQKMTVNSYTEIASLPTPTWTDHRFTGWTENDIAVDLPLQMNDEDIYLVATWKGVSDDFEFRDETDNTITITKYIGDETNVVIPSTITNKVVKTIAEDAFENCSFVESIILSSQVTNLEYKSLMGCTNLKALTLSGNVSGSLKYFFGNNENNVPLSLKTITFAEGSTTYSKVLFDELSVTHLFKVNLPASVTTTPSDVFFNCINIEEAFVPEGVRVLSDRTFCGCTNLKSVNIPSSVTSLGTNCFVNTNLTYLIVPQTVKSFGYASLSVGDALVLFERTEKLSSSSVFSIYEDQMDIYYGFEEIRTNDTFVYALCKVNSVKQAIIISLVDGAIIPAEVPETLDGYPVVLNKIQ